MDSESLPARGEHRSRAKTIESSTSTKDGFKWYASHEANVKLVLAFFFVPCYHAKRLTT